MGKVFVAQDFTNEKLRRKFLNNFDLANYAIEIAKKHIREGDPKTLSELLEELSQLNDEGK